jgi:4,5-DOPA dioxygenase extradiol
VHNLRALQRQAPDDQAYDWAIDFDQRVAEAVAAGDPERLAGFQ